MKTAFAYWDNRIAPVFETAPWLRIVTSESGRIVASGDAPCAEGLVMHKVLRLAELGVDTLVCGALARPAHKLINAYGIQVHSFVAGDLDEVVRAWIQGRLTREAFSMPGCRGRTRQQRRGRQGGRQAIVEKSAVQWRGKGRKALAYDNAAFVSGGECVCPRCGYAMPHERGTPCVECLCPGCGIPMLRR